MVQLPTSVPESEYLKTLLVLASLTTHRCVPSVSMPMASRLPLFRAKLLVGFMLPHVRLAAPA